jgi:hypothetical protein
MVSLSSHKKLLVAGLAMLALRGALFVRRELDARPPSGHKMFRIDDARVRAPYPQAPTVVVKKVALSRLRGKPTTILDDVDVIDASASVDGITWRLWSGSTKRVAHGRLSSLAYQLAREQLPGLQVLGVGQCVLAAGDWPGRAARVFVDAYFAYDDERWWLLSVMRPYGVPPGRETTAFFLQAQRFDAAGDPWYLFDEVAIADCNESRATHMITLERQPVAPIY